MHTCMQACTHRERDHSLSLLHCPTPGILLLLNLEEPTLPPLHLLLQTFVLVAVLLGAVDHLLSQLLQVVALEVPPRGHQLQEPTACG